MSCDSLNAIRYYGEHSHFITKLLVPIVVGRVHDTLFLQKGLRYFTVELELMLKFRKDPILT